jgi:hypothetical protein
MRLHSTITQKALIFILAAVTTWNLTQWYIRVSAFVAHLIYQQKPLCTSSITVEPCSYVPTIYFFLPLPHFFKSLEFPYICNALWELLVGVKSLLCEVGFLIQILYLYHSCVTDYKQSNWLCISLAYLLSVNPGIKVCPAILWYIPCYSMINVEDNLKTSSTSLHYDHLCYKIILQKYMHSDVWSKWDSLKWALLKNSSKYSKEIGYYF